jgi:UDP-glucose 4-epimerase
LSTANSIENAKDKIKNWPYSKKVFLPHLGESREAPSAGEIFVQKSPAASIKTLAYALVDLLGVPQHQVIVIGTRHGEKQFETLLSREEMVAAEDLGNYFRVPPDLRDLNYGKYVEQGEIQLSESTDYNSNNTIQLDPSSMKSLLMKLNYIQSITRGENALAEE